MRIFKYLPGKIELYLTLVLAIIICLLIRYWGLWQEEEFNFFDRFTQWSVPQSSSERIVIVGITEEDLKMFPSTIPDDVTLAKTLAIINQQSPRVIGLNLIRDLPVPPGDAELEQVFQKMSNLYGIGKFTGIEGDPFFLKIKAPSVLESLKRVGDVSVMVDDDGVIRRANLYPTTGDNGIPSIGLLLGQKYLEKEGILSEEGNQGRLKLGKVEFPFLRSDTGSYLQVDSSGYQTLMRWLTPLQKFKQVTLKEVLENRISPNLLTDKIDLIG